MTADPNPPAQEIEAAMKWFEDWESTSASPSMMHGKNLAQAYTALRQRLDNAGAEERERCVERIEALPDNWAVAAGQLLGMTTAQCQRIKPTEAMRKTCIAAIRASGA